MQQVSWYYVHHFLFVSVAMLQTYTGIMPYLDFFPIYKGLKYEEWLWIQHFISLKVRSNNTFGLPSRNSVLVFNHVNSNTLPNSAPLQNTNPQILATLILTFQGHRGCNLMVRLDFPCILHFLLVFIPMYVPTLFLKKIGGVKNMHPWINVTFQDYSRSIWSNLIMYLEASNMTSY